MAGARARAERGVEERDRWDEELGSQVTGMRCRISQYPGRAKGEKRTPRAAARHVGGCIRIRARDTHGLPGPSHESKLFVTGRGEGGERTGTEGGRTYVFAYNKREVMSR